MGLSEELKTTQKINNLAEKLLRGNHRTRLKLETHPNSNFIVLKLGGSVVTNKEIPMTSNTKSIVRLAKEIAAADIKSLIIIHGGGSFGHPLAKKYKIKEGYKEPSQIKGFLKTHQAMLKLNRFIVDALIHHNIPAFSVSPSSCIVTKDGRIQIFNTNVIRQLLKIGLVPVLFGDAILDSHMGFTILSGDQLAAKLAINFKADRIIFGADVDGLFTADPKSDNTAQLMPCILLKELRTMLHRIDETKVTDVTGGMLGKISEVMPAINKGIQTSIVNATKEQHIYKALKGEKIGTLIRKE